MNNSLRQFLEKFLNGKSGRPIDYFSTFLSCFSCIVYVVSTYYPTKWFDQVDIGILSFYLVEYAIRCSFIFVKIYYLF